MMKMDAGPGNGVINVTNTSLYQIGDFEVLNHYDYDTRKSNPFYNVSPSSTMPFVDKHLKFTLRLSALRYGRVISEYKVAIFRRRVAREAGFVQRFVTRLSVLKVSEPPAACRGVLF